MARPKALLPPPSELASVSERVAIEILLVANLANQRAHRYATLGMICGTLSLLGALLAFTFLVVNGHPASAGVVLGSTVIAVVGKMVGSRLSSD